MNQQKLLNLIAQLRATIPEEVKQAEHTLTERERIIAQGREEARRIAEQARVQATHNAEQTPELADARQYAKQIIDQAERQSNQLQAGATQYAHEVLDRLAEQLDALQRQVHNGQDVLSQMQADVTKPQPERRNGSGTHLR